MTDLIPIYRTILAIAGVGIVIATLEVLATLKEYAPGGPFAWRIVGVEVQHYRPIAQLRKVAAPLFGERGLVGLMAVRLVGLAGVLVLPVGTIGFSAAAFALFAGIALFQFRHVYGSDGSDQMSLIIAATVFVALGLSPTSTTAAAGLWFLALQACLSYAAAGWAKVFSAQWRTGTATADIFNTGAYGARWVAGILNDHPTLARLLSWTTVGLEAAFPVCLVAPLPVTLAILAWALTFHAMSAAIMGLNTFFWAFVATYPAIWWAAQQIGM